MSHPKPFDEAEKKLANDRRNLKRRQQRLLDRQRLKADAQIEWDSGAEADLLRYGMRENFWLFFLYGFGAGLNPKGERWIDDDVHRPLADWFQLHVQDWMTARAAGRGRQKHLAVLIHREVGKTTMISEAGQLWLHLLDPDISTATGSESMKLSTKILRAMKSVLDGSDSHSLFTRLFGSWAGSARTWAGTEVVHSARKNTARTDPSLYAFAVETSITGSHPDALFYDDPISYERLESDTNWLQSVNSQVDSLIPVVQGDGLVVFVGTRYDDMDHMGVAFANDGIRSITGVPTKVLPETDPEGLWDVFFMAGRDAKGEPTTPKVWPDARMRRFEKKNPLRYAAQVMNDPSSSETNPVTREQLESRYIDKDKVPWSYLRYAICTDVAFLGEGERIVGKDETTFYIHGYPRDGTGDVYVIEGHGSPMWRGEDFTRLLVSTVQRYRTQGRRVFAITGEKARAGLKDVLRANLLNRFADANEPMPQYIEFERGGKKKYDRLHAMTQFWQDGHVWIVRNSPGSKELIEQICRVGAYAVNPRIKIDRADAHSDAFQRELYAPMRRGPQQSGYLRGATPIPVDGVDPRDYDDDEDAAWLRANPRPPLA